ncbi:hypothetical protein D3C81_561510 [compost metagenome]
MGFEFRIMASLAQEQRQHIAQLIAALPQVPRAPGAMPDTDVRLTDTGLYVCQYLRPEPWHGLEAVRDYFKAATIAHSVHDAEDEAM